MSNDSDNFGDDFSEADRIQSDLDDALEDLLPFEPGVEFREQDEHETREEAGGRDEDTAVAEKVEELNDDITDLDVEPDDDFLDDLDL